MMSLLRVRPTQAVPAGAVVGDAAADIDPIRFAPWQHRQRASFTDAKVSEDSIQQFVIDSSSGDFAQGLHGFANVERK